MTKAEPLPARPGLGARRISAGLADQILLALANAATGLVAYPLLDPTSTGRLLLALAFVYLAIGLNRAFVGDVLLAHSARFDETERRRQVTNAMSVALIAGLVAAGLLAVLWLVNPGGNLGYLIWVAPFIPAFLLHDTGRYAYLAAREPARALVLDLLAVGAQALAVVLVITAGSAGAPLLVCYGVAGLVGATAFLVRSRINPLRGHPREWLAETKYLSGWFTGSAVVGQAQTQVVAFLVTGLLTPTAYAGLRLAQYGLLQPVQNFVLAMMGLLVPRSSRLAAAGDSEGLRKQTRQTLLVTASIAVVGVGLAVALADPLLHWLLPKYAFVSAIALPVGIQAGIYLCQIPFTAAMRGMQRARLLFAQYAIFTVCSLTGLVLGAWLSDLRGAAWGLTIGAAIGFTIMIALYFRAARHLATESRSSFDVTSSPQTPR